MKHSNVKIWEWFAWAVAGLLFLICGIQAISYSEYIFEGILFLAIFVGLVVEMIYRIEHPEKYDEIVGKVTSSMTAEHISGVNGLRKGQHCTLSLKENHLVISDNRRARYTIDLKNLVDAETLTPKEAAVWEKNRGEEDDLGSTEPKFTEKIAEKWEETFTRLLVINYKSKFSGEIQVLSFHYEGALKGTNFVKELKKQAGYDDPVEL